MRTELPEKWKIKYINENLWTILRQFEPFGDNYNGSASTNAYYGYNQKTKEIFCSSLYHYKYEEITLEEFKTLVLGEKQQPTEPQYEIY